MQAFGLFVLAAAFSAIGAAEAADPIGAPARAPGDAGADLGLVCFGDGQRPRAASSPEWRWNDRTRRYDYGARTELVQEHFDASLMIRLAGSTGQIRLPKKLIPPIHSRGQDDWWTLDDVVVGGDAITARYRLNGLNTPRLAIDRRGGRITVTGSGDYSFRGTCDLISESPARRF